LNLNIAGGNAVFGAGGITNYLAGRVFCYPSAVYYPRIQQISSSVGRGIFSQAKLTNVTAGSGGTYIFCLGRPDSANFQAGYGLFIDSTTNVGLAGHGTVFSASVFNWVAGDVIRLEVRIADAATVNLKVFQNGVQKGNFDDTSGARITTGGCYGFYWVGALTSQVSFDSYDGGVL
jgi:hypothetical protein